MIVVALVVYVCVVLACSNCHLECYEYQQTRARHGQSHHSPFIDGLYSGYYKQYNRNYPMKSFEMKFNDGVVTGHGDDCVGEYRINGIYSDKTGEMAISKTYIEGTGDSSQNYGHIVKIKLEYQNKSNRFDGRWNVKTNIHQGSGF